MYLIKAELKMDAIKIEKEWKYSVLCCLFRGIKPGFLQWEFDVTTTMPSIIAVLEIIAMSYLAIRAEDAVKLDLQI